jgi:hypothetical protein
MKQSALVPGRFSLKIDAPRYGARLYRQLHYGEAKSYSWKRSIADAPRLLEAGT